MNKESTRGEKTVSSRNITIALGTALGFGTGCLLKKTGVMGNTFPKASIGLFISGFSAYGMSNLVERRFLDEKNEKYLCKSVLRSTLIRHTGHLLVGFSVGLAASSLL